MAIAVLKEIRAYDAKRSNAAPHCHTFTVERFLMQLIWVIWCPAPEILLIDTPV
jgi:hypothetical protein